MTTHQIASNHVDPTSAPVRAALATAPLFHERRHALTWFFSATTWRAFGYLLTTMLFAPISFTYTITAISLGLPFAVFIVGLVVMAALVLGARWLGVVYRRLANGIVGTNIPAPLPPRRRPGLTGYVVSGLTDGAGWRAMSHSLISFVTALISFTLTTSLLAIGAGATTYAIWRPFLPAQQAPDGTWHRGAQIVEWYFVDTPGRIALFMLLGLVFLTIIWPLANNGMARLEALLAASLLGPSASSLTRAQLEAQRTEAATVNADTMRSIERDLHDVTQEQLVAIAMKLGDVRERLDAGESAEAIVASVAAAHDTSKIALADLRSLVRGIHPAALDAGLRTALQTLAASSAVPVTLNLGIDDEFSAPTSIAAYFCAAELLTNVAKHSGADRAELSAWVTDERLFIAVRDAGKGGAHGLAAVRGRVRQCSSSLNMSKPATQPNCLLATPAASATYSRIGWPRLRSLSMRSRALWLVRRCSIPRS